MAGVVDTGYDIKVDIKQDVIIPAVRDDGTVLRYDL